MGKKGMCLVVCLLLVVSVWTWGLLQDRQYLDRELIRLHIVANSDSEWDQSVKLKVRDAIIDSISADLENEGDVQSAKAYLRDNLSKIQTVANKTLEAAGVDSQAVVTFCKEKFDIRKYDTFSLPAGVYNALRVVIGDGQGKNWWCVAFPALCTSATTDEFEAAAQTAGMDEGLSGTLSGDYQLRFYLLDALGRLENCSLRE